MPNAVLTQLVWRNVDDALSKAHAANPETSSGFLAVLEKLLMLATSMETGSSAAARETRKSV